MPVDYLSEDQRRSYGHYCGEPSRAQLARYFYLDDADMAAVRRCRGDHNRLGFAVQLATVRFLGTFLTEPADVPRRAAGYLAAQLDIGKVGTCLKRYGEAQAHRLHAQEIRRVYGYRDFGKGPEHLRLVRWLYTRAWLSDERPSLLFDLATAWLAERKTLLPGVSTLARLVAQVRDRAAARLWRTLASVPNDAQTASLRALLTVQEGFQHSPLERLRRGPTRVSGPGLVDALRRLEQIRAVGVGDLDLSRIPPGRLRTLARYAVVARAGSLERMPEDRQIATLLAFARDCELTAMDDALDVLDLLLTKLLKKAQGRERQERLRGLPDQDAATLKLWHAVAVLLDDGCEEAEVRSTAFAQVPREDLQLAFDRIAELVQPKEDRWRERLLDAYPSVRRFLPTVLRTIPFQGTQGGRHVLEALAFLASIEKQHCPDMSQAPREKIPRPWRRLVMGPKGEVDRRAYTMYTLECLQDALRRRDIFVERSERWNDPRTKLLRGAEWEAVRPGVLRTLNLERSPEKDLERLAAQLDEAYRRTAGRLGANAFARVEQRNDRPTLVLTGLDKLEEPPGLVDLRRRVHALLPRTDLPEALLEIHARTGFADEFRHISESGSRTPDLAVSICAVLVAEACNIGLEPLVHPEIPALTRDRLSWVQQNYIRSDTIIKANARLVEAQTHIPVVEHWGGGEVASADGLRFVVPIRTVNAGPNPKYFGMGSGITYYNFTSDQLMGFHGIVMPGTLRDSMVLIAGLLEQQTVLRPREIMTDTAGASDLIFGLFWLLGYRFSPRLADLGEARLWRMDPAANYGALDGVARHRINTGLIARNWDDMVRVAGSLKLGRVSASELTRSLLRSQRPSTLARALSELGRIPRTLHILDYIDDPNHRRRILTQLNHGEGRNGMGRGVCHGQRGEIRKRYREGQEDQLGILGLVVNVLVLWNTLYIDASLNHLRQQGLQVHPEDISRLSPLKPSTVNVLGRYSFALPEQISRGELRPLRISADASDLEDWEP